MVLNHKISDSIPPLAPLVPGPPGYSFRSPASIQEYPAREAPATVTAPQARRQACRTGPPGWSSPLLFQRQASGADVFTAVAGVGGGVPLARQSGQQRQSGPAAGREGQVDVL